MYVEKCVKIAVTSVLELSELIFDVHGKS